MSQQLTLEVPDEVYRSLADEAATAGKTVAEVAGERLARKPAVFGSRLRKWAGSADSGMTDSASRVEEYLGRAALGNRVEPGRD